MRTTIDLPDSLYRELKVLAARRGSSLKEVIQEFIELGLHKPIPQRAGEGRPALAFPSISIGKPYPKALVSNAALFELLDKAS